jgi:hypothetical protein
MKLPIKLMTLTGASILATCFACRDDVATREAQRTENGTASSGQTTGTTGEIRNMPDDSIAENTGRNAPSGTGEWRTGGDTTGMAGTRANDNDGIEDRTGLGTENAPSGTVRMREPLRTTEPSATDRSGLGTSGSGTSRTGISAGPDKTRTGEQALPGTGGSAGTTGTAETDSPNDERLIPDNEQRTETAGNPDGGTGMMRDR